MSGAKIKIGKEPIVLEIDPVEVLKLLPSPSSWWGRLKWWLLGERNSQAIVLITWSTLLRKIWESNLSHEELRNFIATELNNVNNEMVRRGIAQPKKGAAK